MGKRPCSENDNFERPYSKIERPSLKLINKSVDSPKSPYKLEKKIASTILSLIYTSYLNSSIIIVKHINKKYRAETIKLTDDIWKIEINKQIYRNPLVLFKEFIEN